MQLKQLHAFCDTQKENRRLSDVLLNDTQWVKSIDITLGKITHMLRQVLLNEMARKNTIMMENPTVLGAVYLDARFQRALSIPQTTNSHIVFTYYCTS